jgi:SAM-dependent methyltransferase
LILRELSNIAESAVGLDLSRGMLRKARDRGLNVVEGSATALPFADGSFDSVCSFKVLAHVQDIETALQEVGRVLRPGGRAALEFYNRRSLRYLLKMIKRPDAISDSTTDEDVFTRYDDLETIRNYLPPTLRLDGIRGIRVFTPFAGVHKWPGVGPVLGWMERVARDNPLTRPFGGFLVVMLTRTD